jgi:hypothetical protein
MKLVEGDYPDKREVVCYGHSFLYYLQPGQYLLYQCYENHTDQWLVDGSEVTDMLMRTVYSGSSPSQWSLYELVPADRRKLLPDELVAELAAQELER